jgi:hypothetical protein
VSAFSIETISAMWSFLDEPVNFLAIRVAADSAELILVGRRPWSRGGFGEHLVLRGHPSELEARLSTFPGIPVAVLVPATAGELDVDVVNRLLSALPDRTCSILTDDRGRLSYGGTELEDFAAPDYEPASLSIGGRERLVVHECDFPVTVNLTIADQDDRANILRLDASSPYDLEGVALPAPCGVRISGVSGTVALEIAVLPGLRQDRWAFQLAPPGVVRQIQAPAVPRKEMPGRVVLLFDRTCPDAASWSNARKLTLGAGNSAAASYAQDDTKAPPPAHHDLNNEIRDGLANGLAARLETEDTELNVVWFADTAGDDLSSPDGLNMPAQSCALAGALVRPSRQSIGTVLDPVRYSPGLDLWDPVDEALGMAAELLEREPGRCGVVIVGNSPPTFPTQESSPLIALSGATSYRRLSPAWHELLDRLAARRTPVVYLFLTMKDCPRGEQSEFDLYKLLETRLYSAMTRTAGLRVISRPADRAGVEEGIQTALNLLSAPGSYSTIEVRI